MGEGGRFLGLFKGAAFSSFLLEMLLMLVVCQTHPFTSQLGKILLTWVCGCVVGRKRLEFGLLTSLSCRSALLRDSATDCSLCRWSPSPSLLLIHRYLFEQMRLRRCCQTWRVSPRGKSLGWQQLPWWEARSLHWPCLAKPRVWSP